MIQWVFPFTDKGSEPFHAITKAQDAGAFEQQALSLFRGYSV
jgi:hypothetical protein